MDYELFRRAEKINNEINKYKMAKLKLINMASITIKLGDDIIDFSVDIDFRNAVIEFIDKHINDLTEKFNKI